MISNADNTEAFVWIWLPGETQPVVAGKLEAVNGIIHFNYGKSYLDRSGDKNPAIPIYEPELPLRAGLLPLLNDLEIPNCIRDAAPDAWGRRVIINKKFGLKGRDADTGILDELTGKLGTLPLFSRREIANLPQFTKIGEVSLIFLIALVRLIFSVHQATTCRELHAVPTWKKCWNRPRGLNKVFH